MSLKQRENTQEKISATYINVTDDRIEVKEASSTFEEVFASVKEIDPDFPEAYYRKVFDLTLAGQKGELKDEDFEPGGRFSPEIMDPITKAMKELYKKDMAYQRKKQFENKKIVLGALPKDGSGKMEIRKIPLPEFAETLRKTNPDLTDEQLDLAIDFLEFGRKDMLSPQLFKKGAYFEPDRIKPALKEFFKAAQNEAKYEQFLSVINYYAAL